MESSPVYLIWGYTWLWWGFAPFFKAHVINQLGLIHDQWGVNVASVGTWRGFLRCVFGVSVASVM